MGMCLDRNNLAAAPGLELLLSKTSIYLVPAEDFCDGHGGCLSSEISLENGLARLSAKSPLEPAIHTLDFCTIKPDQHKTDSGQWGLFA